MDDLTLVGSVLEPDRSVRVPIDGDPDPFDTELDFGGVKPLNRLVLVGLIASEPLPSVGIEEDNFISVDIQAISGTEIGIRTAKPTVELLIARVVEREREPKCLPAFEARITSPRHDGSIRIGERRMRA